MSREVWEVGSTWGKKVNSLAKRFTCYVWVMEGNYVWCLVIVVIFIGQEQKGSSFGVVIHKWETSFYGGFSKCSTHILKHLLKSYWLL